MHGFMPLIRCLKANPINYIRLVSRLFSSQQSHFENVGPMASLLKSRAVVRFRGPDTVKFLQGLVTNDLRRFVEPMGKKTSTLATPNISTVLIPPVYAALLNPQGRFLYDMFIYRFPRKDERLDRTGSGVGQASGELELVADVDRSVLDEFLATLKKYQLRSNVDIENVADDFYCWQRYGGNLTKKSSLDEPEAAGLGWGASVDQSGISSSQGNEHGWQWYMDPRLNRLGFRGIFPSNTMPPLVEADKETDEQNFILWRLEEGVAEGSAEIARGEAIPLEYNLAGLNAISFDKGCYVGQELIARTHHRGVIRKRLLPLKFVDDNEQELDQKVAPGSEVINDQSSKKVGTVTTAMGSRGLGLLRLDDAFKGSGNLRIQGQDSVKVKAIKPGWWPAEWFQEHQHVSADA